MLHKQNHLRHFDKTNNTHGIYIQSGRCFNPLIRGVKGQIKYDPKKGIYTGFLEKGIKYDSKKGVFTVSADGKYFSYKPKKEISYKHPRIKTKGKSVEWGNHF